MPLVKCKDCGHSVSQRARKCPECGAPVYEVNLGFAVIGILLVAAIGGYMAYYIAKDEPLSMPPATPAGIEQPLDNPANP